MAASVGGLSWLWGRTSKSFDELRKVAINLLVLMPVCLIVYTVYQAVDEDVMIIDSFTMPKSLIDEGYTSTIIAKRVIDSVKDVHSTANARVDRLQIGHESQFASLSNLQVPQSGLTLQTFVSLLRKVFNLQDDKIEGDIRIKQATRDSHPQVYVMSLRFDIEQNTAERLGRPTDSRHFVKRVEATSLDGLVEQAAQAIVGKTSPAVLASYLYQAQEWEKLDNLLDQLVESSKQKIKARALVLRGLRLVDQCQIDEALVSFKGAVDVNPQSRFAMVKYGDALAKAGRPKEAIQIFEKADKARKGARAPSVLLYGSWAKALAVSDNVAKGDLSEDNLSQAEAKLAMADREAAKRGGRDSRIYRIWGDILLDAKKYEQAKEKYRIAVALDPQDSAAYEKWGRVLFDQRDFAGAIEKYRRAIAKNERAAEPRYRLGWALLSQGNIEDAIKAFEEAAKVAAPTDAARWSDMVKYLSLESVEKLAPQACSQTAKDTALANPKFHDQARP
jgi:tetratricopeptide (TPR) repeat protein